MALNLLRMEIRREHDVVLVRQRARQIAAALKFDSQDQTRIATALSELARNAYQYAGGGMVDFQIQKSPEPHLQISVSDKGRGIPDINQVLEGKYVSPTGMGLGIIGAKRLMDTFRVDTSSKGTTILIGKNIPSKSPVLAKKELDSLLTKFEVQGPQNAYEELQQQNQELLRTLDELRARQMELAQLNRELDETNRGVVALYAELDDRADFLQRASELKSHFLSNMSHEFRTPLNSISALSQILLDRLDGELSSEQEKQVRFIKSSAQDLTDLVNDLLDLAKVEAGKVTIRPSQFDVSTLFSALRGMLRPLLAQNSSVKLQFDDPDEDLQIFSDEAKVSQILRNFISNALKFTERGEVRVSVSRGSDKTVAFSVADTGIGIKEEDQERIFQEWTQVEGKLQKVAKGTGLGLPLSRKLAQLLGGNVHVKSEVGVGSTFTVVIPIAFEGQTEVVFVPEVKRELDANRIPVLVVEDNSEALFIYEKYLKGSKFQVIPANNIAEARQAVRAFRPRAIVLDVLLQGEHSWDFLRDLKDDPTTRDIPVYVITVVDNRDKALSLGADGFHSKPVDRIWLLKKLESIAVSFTKPRILVIDDDAASRYLVRSLLSTGEYELVEANGGDEGLRMVHDCKPALVVLDLTMEGTNGFEVLDTLRRDARTHSLPVVVHTSRSLDDEDYERLKSAIDIIPKSIMSSRDLATMRFSKALDKAGITDAARVSQPVSAS
ncbi:MAG TPA: ATP-binding protein [Candidatus Sulfotelmatobacter sp.]|nr:ATP-binding protein [Candidatus Sulfotelmatobacter sp.]